MARYWLGLQAKRVGFGKALELHGFEGLDRLRFINLNIFIKLPRQHGMKIVTGEFDNR